MALAVQEHQRWDAVGHEGCYFSDETCSCSLNGEVPSDPCPDPILALAILDTLVDHVAAALALAVQGHRRRYVVGHEGCYFSDETCSCSLNGAVLSDLGPVPNLALAMALAGYVVDHSYRYFSDETCSCS